MPRAKTALTTTPEGSMDSTKHELSFIELHNPFFMQGSNMGTKINAAQKGAKLLLDDTRYGVWIYYKQKVAFVPLASVASIDLTEIPGDVKTALHFEEPKKAAAAIKHMAPTQPVVPMYQPEPVPMPDFDPSDAVAAAAHKSMVRAASMNTHRSAPIVQNDQLIQEARNTAMGMKTHPTAQASTAHQVGQMTNSGTQGKPKPISHQALKASLPKE